MSLRFDDNDLREVIAVFHAEAEEQIEAMEQAWLAAATILGDGRVALILDVAALLGEALRPGGAPPAAARAASRGSLTGHSQEALET